jgi:hypothetical protein
MRSWSPGEALGALPPAWEAEGREQGKVSSFLYWGQTACRMLPYLIHCPQSRPREGALWPESHWTLPGPHKAGLSSGTLAVMEVLCLPYPLTQQLLATCAFHGLVTNVTDDPNLRFYFILINLKFSIYVWQWLSQWTQTQVLSSTSEEWAQPGVSGIGRH